ncbi:ABC transporter permease [Mesorhizobium sp. 10J20-29]
MADANALPGKHAVRRALPNLRQFAIHAAILIALLSAWEWVTWTGIADALIFPRPTDILISAWRIYVVNANIWHHLFITVTEVLSGFVLGSALGIVLAIIVGLSPAVRSYLKPYVVVLEATPRIAMGPLIIAWLGFGWSSKIAIVTLVCFFPPFVNTLAGILNVDSEALQLFRSLRATSWQTFRKLMLPDAMPLIMAGLRLAMAAALGGALVAEFISANEGMGVLLSRYTEALNMGSSFASLLTLTLLGFTIYRLMEFADNRIVYWQHAGRLTEMSRRRAVQWCRRLDLTVDRGDSHDGN